MGGNHQDQLFATGLSFSERMRLPSVVVTSTSRTLRPLGQGARRVVEMPAPPAHAEVLPVEPHRGDAVHRAEAEDGARLVRPVELGAVERDPAEAGDLGIVRGEAQVEELGEAAVEGRAARGAELHLPRRDDRQPVPAGAGGPRPVTPRSFGRAGRRGVRRSRRRDCGFLGMTGRAGVPRNDRGSKPGAATRAARGGGPACRAARRTASARACPSPGPSATAGGRRSGSAPRRLEPRSGSRSRGRRSRGRPRGGGRGPRRRAAPPRATSGRAPVARHAWRRPSAAARAGLRRGARPACSRPAARGPATARGRRPPVPPRQQQPRDRLLHAPIGLGGVLQAGRALGLAADEDDAPARLPEARDRLGGLRLERDDVHEQERVVGPRAVGDPAALDPRPAQDALADEVGPVARLLQRLPEVVVVPGAGDLGERLVEEAVARPLVGPRPEEGHVRLELGARQDGREPRRVVGEAAHVRPPGVLLAKPRAEPHPPGEARLARRVVEAVEDGVQRRRRGRSGPCRA